MKIIGASDDEIFFSIMKEEFSQLMEIINEKKEIQMSRL